MAVAKKISRIDLRIEDKDKKILELAASNNHLSLSSYILSICLKQAELDLQQIETIKLNNKQKEIVMNLLDESRQPNQELKNLFI